MSVKNNKNKMRKTGEQSKKRKTEEQNEKRLENFVEETKRKEGMAKKNFKIRTKGVNDIVNQVSQSFFGDKEVKKQPSLRGILVHDDNKDVIDLQSYEFDAKRIKIKTPEGKQEEVTVFAYKKGDNVKAVEILEDELKRVVPDDMEQENLVDLGSMDKKSKSKK